MSEQPPEWPLPEQPPPEQPPPEQPPPEPTPAPTRPEEDHPVRIVVTDDLKRSRLTVLVRLFLAIPHFIWVSLYAIPVMFVIIAAWFVALIKGRVPDRMHRYLYRYQVYVTYFTAYTNLLANPYPPFHGEPGTYQVTLHVDPPERQSRVTIAFRLPLAIPAMILTWVFQQVLQILAFLGWFACLALGRMPKGMRDLGIYCLRYQEQTYCYLSLLTGRYPSLSGPTL